eukprot:CAMPEP_0197032796 /NCGR_PEP_ID=MMETSP1384-20130603/11375_1 /TAXON_ID=29189 /ORGANISM="Ammonia sp." /LENGTH=624 /DNA_ID=CAMNT_0042462501 /DNA_START=23 /DNA_END=1897 /DNA_ORIENTATION=+
MFSEWVDSCKSSILQSNEWRKVSIELQSVLEDKLLRDGVGFFADLTEEEQLAYIKQIKRYHLKDTLLYQQFIDRLQDLIERHISMEIEKLEQLQQADKENKNKDADISPLNQLTRLDKILYITAEGTAKLLHDVPYSELLNQLSSLSNTALSPNLRKEIWKLLLFHHDKKYYVQQQHDDEEASVDTTRSAAFSVHIATNKGGHIASPAAMNTFRITEQCENILLTLSQTIEIPNCPSDLNALLPLIKNVMLKYHEEIGFFQVEHAELCDKRYFYLIIPIVVTVSDFLIEPIINKISMYDSFEAVAFKWFQQLTANNQSQTEQRISFEDIRFGTNSYHMYYQQIEQLIASKTPNLFAALQNIAVSAQLIAGKPDEEEKDTLNIDDNINWIRAIIEPLIEEMVEYWFVPVVNIETCLHIWDQLFLRKLDTLPMIVVSLLNLIVQNLADCRTVNGFITICKRFLPTLHYTKFMQQMRMLQYKKSDILVEESSAEHEIRSDSPVQMLRPLTAKKVEVPKNTHIVVELPKEPEPPKETKPKTPSPPPPPPRLSVSTVSVANKKLLAAALMIGKLQKIREVIESRKPAIPPVDSMEQDPQQHESGKDVTKLVLEECAGYILRGLRDIGNL